MFNFIRNLFNPSKPNTVKTEKLFWDGAKSIQVMPKRKVKLSDQARKTISNYQSTKFKDRMKIDQWQEAITQAEQPPYYYRYPLYQIYQWSLDDGQISSGIQTRKNKVLAEAFSFIDSTGKENKELTKLFKSLPFYDFLENALDTKFWGHTLLEIDANEQGLQAVSLIDREFVAPSSGLFLANPLLYSSSGLPYREFLDELNLIEIGKTKDLGLLRKASRYAIWKNYSFSDWSRHSEKYGMPTIITHTDTTDEVELDELARDLSELGSNGWAILSNDDKVTLLEQNATNAHEIYKQFIDSNDAQISKILNGQTMTADNGSSRSQAEVHERVLDSYIESDMRWLSFIINKDLLPFLLSRGLTAIEGHEFVWKHFNQEKKDPTQPSPFGRAKKTPLPEGEGLGVGLSGAVPFFDSALLINTSANIAKTGVKLAGLYQLSEKPPLENSRFAAIWQQLAKDLYAKDTIDPTPLLLQTAKELQKALFTGGVSYDSLPDLAATMTENIFVFSGFKTYQELQQASALLRDAQGKLRSFADFKKEIAKLNNTYHGGYLHAEYNQAVASAQMAVKWKKFENEKDNYDLVYDAVGDKRTRPEHAAIDGVVQPVDSPFWDTHYPPNGWNCRCTVYQVDKGTKGTTLPTDLPANPTFFQNNVGKTGVVFPNAHPYFQNLTEKQRKEVKGNIEKAVQLRREAKILNIEKEMRTLTKERGIIFDKFGNILEQTDGTLTTVFFKNNELVKNNYVTHNHTEDSFFSTHDIRFVVVTNPTEFRAILSDRIISITRPDKGWDPEDLLDEVVYFFSTEGGGENITGEQLDHYLEYEIGNDIIKKLGWTVKTIKL